MLIFQGGASLVAEAKHLAGTLDVIHLDVTSDRSVQEAYEYVENKLKDGKRKSLIVFRLF